MQLQHKILVGCLSIHIALKWNEEIQSPHLNVMDDWVSGCAPKYRTFTLICVHKTKLYRTKQIDRERALCRAGAYTTRKEKENINNNLTTTTTAARSNKIRKLRNEWISPRWCAIKQQYNCSKDDHTQF